MNCGKFEIAEAEHQAFLAKLGELTLAWSDVETVLYKVLKYYSGVSWPVAQAIFSGTRARQAINFVRAIADNEKIEPTRSKDLEEIFAQILAINTLRDFIVHNVNGSEQEFEDCDPTKRHVSDTLRVSRKSKAKSYLIGSETLAAMCADCIECCWRLHPHWDPLNTPFNPGSGRGERRPWSFTPPNQIRKHDF